MPDANFTSADQNPDAITLPRAILFDLDDTILAAGQRLEVLRLIAREFEPELAPLQPDDVAERLAAPQRLGIFAIWHDGFGKGLPEGSSVRPASSPM